MANKPSKRAIDLIVATEVTSQAYYEKKLRKPEWPGGASGVTIAVGYDLGYANEDKIRRDWTGKIAWSNMLGFQAKKLLLDLQRLAERLIFHGL